MDNVRHASIIIALEELRRPLVSSDTSIQRESSSRRPRRERGESGAEYIHRLLNENATSCFEQLRLDRVMFRQLVDLMIARNLLVDGKYIKVDEQIGICLYILAKGSSYRDVADRFKHSISTICMYFKKVLDALVILSHDIIRPHHDLLEVPPEVENNSLYWPYFKDAIGAIDGTHIEAEISDRTSTPFRNRNGRKTWNVLGCCSFDRIFTFINVGWEGSAHNLTVWRDSLTASKYVFPHPPDGKYYLVDSGYLNTVGYLSPICDPNVRYHMPEFKHGPLVGMLEHFNYRHSSLRMKVECAFGRLKKRWKVLKTMPQMLPKYQMSIIVSCFTLHNFIQMHKLGIPIVQHDAVIGRTDTNLDDKNRISLMSKVRMDIAEAIWKDNNPEAHEDGVPQNDNEEHMEVDDADELSKLSNLNFFSQLQAFKVISLY